MSTNNEKDGFEYRDLGLENLFKAISGELPKAKVGILGDKSKRKKGDKSNADVGLRHEMGEDGMPVRSFLRTPLMDKLQKYIDKSKAFSNQSLQEVLDSGKINTWVRKIGVIGESVVGDAFMTGGFGKWKPSNYAKKKVHQTLVETQQLRDSITSELVESD